MHLNDKISKMNDEKKDKTIKKMKNYTIIFKTVFKITAPTFKLILCAVNIKFGCP